MWGMGMKALCRSDVLIRRRTSMRQGGTSPRRPFNDWRRGEVKCDFFVAEGGSIEAVNVSLAALLFATFGVGGVLFPTGGCAGGY